MTLGVISFDGLKGMRGRVVGWALVVLLAPLGCESLAQSPLQDQRKQAVFRSLARRYGESEALTRRRLALFTALEKGLRLDAANASKDAGLKSLVLPLSADLNAPLEALRELLSSGDANPLISESCLHQAAERSFAHWVAASGGDVGLEERRRQWNVRLLQAPDANMASYLAGLVKCGEACLAHAVELLSCHVLEAAALEHRLVAFDYNDPDPPAEGLSLIREAARKLEGETELRVVLVARTPKPDRPGLMTLSMKLARLRLNRVADELRRLGIGDDRLSMMALGWQEPQVDETVAEIYGYQELRLRFGSAALNRSVQIIFHHPEAD